MEVLFQLPPSNVVLFADVTSLVMLVETTQVGDLLLLELLAGQQTEHRPIIATDFCYLRAAQLAPRAAS